MLKKYILGLILSLSVFSFATFSVYAQEDRQLTTDDYSVTSEYDYEKLYESLEGLGNSNESLDDLTNNFEYDSLSAEEQAAAEAMIAMFGGAFLFVFIIFGIFLLIKYIVMSWTFMVIAKKMNIKDAWLAWIPLINFVLLNRMAGISEWAILLIIFPGVNAIYICVVMVLATMKACEKFGLEKMLSLLMLLPVVNLFFLGYLAWGKHKPKTAEVVNE